MAKVQLKKKPAKPARSAPKSSAARPKHAAAAKPAKKAAPKSAAKPAAKKKTAPPQKKAKAVKPAKSTKSTKAAKPAPKAAKVIAKKPEPKKAAAPRKPEPKKPEPKPSKVKAVVAAAAKVTKAAAKVAVAAAAAPVVAKVASAAAKAAAAADKKRARRPRTRLSSGGPVVANWFSQEKARPSSFIPAPPRAEAPSLVAAPPASSDRLIRPEDLTQLAVRTVPVRVDIEQGGGRVFISVNPQEVVLRPNEGIEWDFRYLGGADVTVDEVLIEFDRPSPFGSASFKSRKPGTARPHRQLSGGAAANSAGRRVQYSIRAMSAFKTELASARPSVNILVA